MNGGGRRQLPSWMLRPCTVEQTSVSEVIQENNENNSDKLDTVASLAQKKVKRKKNNSEVSFVENKSHLLKKCEGRTSDRKSSLEDEDQLESDPDFLKQSRKRKGKIINKRGRDRRCGDLAQSNLETDDGSARKKNRCNTSREKMAEKSMDDSHDGAVLREDELTVEDLLSIAKEYVDAEMKEPKKLQFKSETRSSMNVIRPEKVPTVTMEDRKLHADKPLSFKSLSTNNHAQEMLDLLLGDLLKKTEKVERNDGISRNMMLDYEISKPSENDTVLEVVPVVKKKVSLKDKVAMLLD